MEPDVSVPRWIPEASLGFLAPVLGDRAAKAPVGVKHWALRRRELAWSFRAVDHLEHGRGKGCVLLCVCVCETEVFVRLWVCVCVGSEKSWKVGLRHASLLL